MKKIVALVLTLVLVFSMTAVPVFADTIDKNGSASKNVTASYKAGTSAGTTVYSVTITWGAMEFTYTDGAWNPAKHEYNGSWSYEEGSNIVTVTNHSNAPVTAQLDYTPEQGYNSITGTFDKDTLGLATAEGTAVDAAPTDQAALTLENPLKDKDASNTTVGKVTVKLV